MIYAVCCKLSKQRCESSSYVPFSSPNSWQPSWLMKQNVRFPDLLFLVLDKKSLRTQNICLVLLQVTVPSGDPIHFYLLFFAFVAGITKDMMMMILATQPTAPASRWVACEWSSSCGACQKYSSMKHGTSSAFSQPTTPPETIVFIEFFKTCPQ